jgi:hypothetical protein
MCAASTIPEVDADAVVESLRAAFEAVVNSGTSGQLGHLNESRV